MASTYKNRSRSRPWVVISAIAGCVIAVALVVLLAATDRGARGLQRLRSVLHGPSPIVGEGPERVVEREVIKEVTKEVVREVEVPVGQADEDPNAPNYNLRTLYNGIQLEAKLDKKEGVAASSERTRDESYRLSVTLQLSAPKPVTSLDGLMAVQPGISSLLPGLSEMITTARVSPHFEKLYANKEARIRKNILQLDKLLSRHNYFDCETFLELRHPKSGRHALLLQAEMDVVSDGSDGDRLPEMPEKIVNSAFYQPTTSYGWPKKSSTPNPLIVGIEARVKKAKEEYAVPGLSAEKNAELKATIDEGTRQIAELKRRSFLIAEYDPFIVLPVFVILDKADSPYKVRVGDYAAVIHENRIYPAILGDAGPDFKVGEASLRIGKEIDARTNPYRRPINDLKATYIVFPGSAEETKDAPNLVHWQKRCEELITEIGGLGPGVTLHVWEDILQRMANEREAKRLAEIEAARLKAEAEAAAKRAQELAPQNTPESPSSPNPAPQNTAPPSTPEATPTVPDTAPTSPQTAPTDR